jgi:hypothetical protein
MKKFFFLFLCLLGYTSSKLWAQCSSSVIAGASTSGNFRGLNPNFGRGCAVYLLTAADMAAAGYTNGVVLGGMGGSFSTAPNTAVTGTLAIYLENTADVANNKSTNWLTALTGMTNVHNASFTCPAATTWDATFSTPFTYTGDGVYVAIEWTNCGALATGSIVQCNTVLLAGVKSAQSAACAAITTVGANSSFRPTTRFQAAATNLSLLNIWPHGQIPAGAGAKEVIPFTVRNTFATAQSVTAQLVIKEAVSGTIRHTEFKAITIPACGEASGTFDHWIPQIQETDSVIITIPLQPGETVTSDNTAGTTEIVGAQNYSHAKNAFGGSFSGVGFNTGSGLILSRYSANGCVSVTNVKVRLDPSAVGNTVYGVVVSPAGLILGQSPNYVVQAADANTVVNFTLTMPVAVSAGDFYVGLAQTANAVTGYFPVSCQGENPTKPNAFYTTGLVGGALSTPYTNLNRWYIEADIAATPNVYANIATQPLFYCAGSSFPVEYTVLNGTLNAGNVFTVELSDGAGSFAAPTVIGTLSSTASIGTITATIPLSTPASSTYRIRVNASNNAITGCTGNTQLNIFGAPVFTSVTPTDATCNGAANGSVVVSSPAVLPVFAINPAGAQGPAGTFNGLAANTYTVTVTDGNGCSNTTTAVVGQPAPLAAAISATPLCTNGNAILTGSATGGTPSYTYQWISGFTTGSVTLNPSKDNTIFQDLSTNSNGAGQYFSAGNDGTNSPRRALMAFDFGTVPTGATITGATLTLNCSQTSGAAGAQAQNLHVLQQNWGEGASNGPGGTGAAATPNDATWLNAFNPGTPWTNAGGVFNPVASATQTVNATGFYSWTSPTMIADIQAWIAQPAANYGWLLKGTESAAFQAKRYDSKENLTLANRPTLVVNYSVPVIAGTGPTLSIATAGTYTVIVTDANGCTATTTISVTALPLPTVTASASPSTICQGASSTLTGGGATTYSWDPGALTGNPSVTPASTTIYSVTGTDGNGCTNTSTVEVTVNTAPSPVVTADSVCSPGGVVNLSATGTQVSWYDQLTGGTLLNTGLTYNPSISATTTYYVENSTTVVSGPFAVPMPNQTGTFTGNVRGYWFTAPTNFTMTSIQVPPTANAGPQSIAVVKFTGNVPPPVFSGTTNAFTTVFLTQSNPAPGNITVNIPVAAGEVIGILGVRNTVTSYSNTGNTVTIGGFSVPLTRMGMQFNLVTTAPQNLWQEPSSQNIGRVEFEYTLTVPGCTSTPRVPVMAVLNPLPVVTATPASQALCQNSQATVAGGGAASYVWTGGITDNTPFTVTGSNVYTVTGTDANGCTNTATAEVTMNNLPVVTATPATQTVCENTQTSIAGGGATSYSWTGGISDNTPFTVTASATYTVTGTDGNGCTNTATAQVNMNAAPVVNGSVTPATGCQNTTAVPGSSGTATTYAWSGGLQDGVPFLVGLGSTSYTLTGTDGNGCTATSSVTVTGTAPTNTLPGTTANSTQNHGDDLNASYYDASCNLIASVDDGAGGNILGLTTATVNVQGTAGFHNGQPFVRRWYQITPTSNGAADVQLYITQADFDNYNSVVTAPYLPLPTGPADVTGIANVRITKNADAGLGNSPVEITPTVSWNGSYWVLSFSTPSFSQFRVHSANPGGTPLPVTLTNFDGRKLNSSNLLEWSTSAEQSNAYFNLQYSTNGTDFTTIAKVDSKAPNGMSATTLNYSYEHNTPALGHNYYRLQQVDLDGNSAQHAKVVDLIWGASGSTVSLYPNPTKDVLNIDLYTTRVQNTTVKVLDMSGRIVKQIQARSEAGMNKLSISLGDIASGVYTVQVFENDVLSHVGKVELSK